jgi:hypothetical protein
MPAGSSFLIKEGMLSDKICRTEFNGEPFYSIGIRNQMLHAAHPLGWFCAVNLSVDGNPVSKEDVFFEIRGQWICTAQMHTIMDIFWYIMEEARLNFRRNPELVSGAHDVECEFVASLLEVATQPDRAGKWPRRRQAVTQKAYL